MRERLELLLQEVEHGDQRKKLSPEEIEQKKKEAEELGLSAVKEGMKSHEKS